MTAQFFQIVIIPIALPVIQTRNLPQIIQRMVNRIINILRRNIFTALDHQSDLFCRLRPCVVIIAFLICGDNVNALAVIAHIRHIRAGVTADPVFLLKKCREFFVSRLMLFKVFCNAQFTVHKTGAATEIITQKLCLFIDFLRLVLHAKQTELLSLHGHRKTACRFG